MMRLIAALVLLLATPAFATQDQWPALFDVIDVGADDVLNIRAKPDAAAEIIGEFAPDATDIEVIRPNERQGWGLVNAGERTGWVSLTFLQRQPGQWLGAPLKPGQCFGTEPFWSVAFSPPRITLTSPEIEPREGILSSFYSSLSHRGRSARTGSLFPGPWGARDVHFMFRLEACTDGMSDHEYGIGVDMLLTRPEAGGDDSMTGLFTGCCSLSAPPAR